MVLLRETIERPEKEKAADTLKSAASFIAEAMAHDCLYRSLS